MAPILRVLYRKTYVCNECDFEDQRLGNIRRHVIERHWNMPINEANTVVQCPLCDEHVRRAQSHISRNHIQIQFNCKRCPEKFRSERQFSNHANDHHNTPPNSPFHEIESAFNRQLQIFHQKFKDGEHLTLESAFVNLGLAITKLIKYQLQLKLMLKFSLIFKAKYAKYDELGNVADVRNIYLRSLAKPVLLGTSHLISNYADDAMLDLVARNEQFLHSGSGWSLHEVLGANVEVGSLHIHGGCNLGSRIKGSRRKHIIDAETLDKECFFNSIAIGLMPQENWALGSKKLGILARAYTSTHFNTKGITTPVEVREVAKFERKNDHLKIRINVYTVLNDDVVPVYVSSANKNWKNINLLLVENSDVEHHYVYLNNFDLFCGDSHNRYYHCGYCLVSFSTPTALIRHQETCSLDKPVKIEYPEEGSMIEFKSHSKREFQAIFGTCDFEASVVPISRKQNAIKYNCANCHAEGDKKYCMHNTTDCHHQIPTTYSLCLVDKLGTILYEKTESHEANVMELFFKTLDYVETTFYPLTQQNKIKTDYTREENLAFEAAVRCCLCQGYFSNRASGKSKVRDHCHYTGQFIGAAHHDCNWRRTVARQIPIFIHNFRNYDSQFILQGLKYSQSRIQGLPYNMEKFRTVSVGKISFVDSLELLPSSLDSLVTNLRASEHHFPMLDQIPCFMKFPHLKDLLLQKGIYPYEWASSTTKLLNTTSFPKQKHFKSLLRGTDISDDEYAHAIRVFKEFECKNMLEYCHLYCRLDTVLLLEVMVKFRDMVKTEFNLDCTQYISTPQLAFDCMLAGLDEPIELMFDPEMIALCEKNIRGGVSFVNERHVQLANYEDKKEGENIENKVQDQLLYIDANNLYSVAQSAPMPHSNYEWCSNADLTELKSNVQHIPIDNDLGFILEVDLKYPNHLHADHASLPLLPDHCEFTFDDLSPFSQASLQLLRGEKQAKKYRAQKLVTNVKDKQRYVLHYRNLQTYLKAGLEIGYVHRAIKFTQKRYLKPYIDKCTQKRVEAQNVFEKMLWKLFMNAVYGKFIQNNRKHFEVKICTKAHFLQKYYNSIAYKGHRILDENVVCVYLSKMTIKLDRLYATGFSILELSKEHMYRSWYQFIQPALGKENVSIVLTDTDSFILHIRNMSRSEAMDRLADCMDFSNYPKDHPRFSEQHKAVPGYFKDENCGNYMTEVIGLKSKCYITEVKNRSSKLKKSNVVCKGVTKTARAQLTMQTFRNVVKDFQVVHAEMYCIRSKKHNLYTQKLRKIALSTTDDKRYLKNCGIHTLPHGSIESKLCTICC